MSSACLAAYCYSMVLLVAQGRDKDPGSHLANMDLVAVVRACAELHAFARARSAHGLLGFRIPFALTCAKRIMWAWLSYRRVEDAGVGAANALQALMSSDMWTDFGACLASIPFPAGPDAVCRQLIAVFDLRLHFMKMWAEQGLPFETESERLGILRDAFAVAVAHLHVCWNGVAGRWHLLQQFGAAMEAHAAKIKSWSTGRWAWIGAVVRAGLAPVPLRPAVTALALRSSPPEPNSMGPEVRRATLPVDHQPLARPCCWGPGPTPVC